jgi:two-component system, NarL family, nitrate/nitrite response regulator NarL
MHVMIVDDHALVRAGVRARLALEPDIARIDEAESGEEALERLAAAGNAVPDLLLADISLRGINGIELLRRVRHAHPALRVIVLSMYEHREYVTAAARAGASGYVLKDGPLDEIVQALQVVAAGGQYWSRPVAELVAGVREGETPITDREREVMLLLAHGRSNRQVAEVLGISVRTVETHRYNLRRRLGVDSPSEFLKLAVANGWTKL